MSKRVHPNEAVTGSSRPTVSTAGDFHSPVSPEAGPSALTVWRKSLLFNFDGFTVFDGEGNLIFRVDRYMKSGNNAEIDLMDASGNTLLTIRRKKLSLGERWQIYEGEDPLNPRFWVRKHANFIQSKPLARVTPCRGPSPSSGGDSGEGYDVEGSYAQRCCAVYDEKRRIVAEIRRKEAAGGATFGLDVFRLIVQPGFDVTDAMAIVVVLEEMFGTKSSLIRF